MFEYPDETLPLVFDILLWRPIPPLRVSNQAQFLQTLSVFSNAFQWTHNRGISGVGMFNDLPLTFQAELSLMINKKALEKVCNRF